MSAPTLIVVCGHAFTWFCLCFWAISLAACSAASLLACSTICCFCRTVFGWKMQPKRESVCCCFWSAQLWATQRKFQWRLLASNLGRPKVCANGAKLLITISISCSCWFFSNKDSLLALQIACIKPLSWGRCLLLVAACCLLLVACCSRAGRVSLGPNGGERLLLADRFRRKMQRQKFMAYNASWGKMLEKARERNWSKGNLISALSSTKFSQTQPTSTKFQPNSTRFDQI